MPARTGVRIAPASLGFKPDSEDAHNLILVQNWGRITSPEFRTPVLIACFYCGPSSKSARIAGFADGGYTEPTYETAKRDTR